MRKFSSKKPIRTVRSTASVRSGYDRLSGAYDCLITPLSGQFSDRGVEMLSLRDGERVIEIGYGTGRCVEAMARSVGQSGRICGVDISIKMHDIARQRIERAGLGSRVDLRVGDAAKMEFEQSSFDAVFSSFTFELFPGEDLPLLLSRCRRVLKRGGRICAVSFSANRESGEIDPMAKLYRTLSGICPNMVGLPYAVRGSLMMADFKIAKAETRTLLGFPVEIVVGVK